MPGQKGEKMEKATGSTNKNRSPLEEELVLCPWM